MTARVVVVGESLIDVVERADGHRESSPGGSPANVAVALGRLGQRVSFYTQFADDAYGRTLAAWLGDAGVEARVERPLHAPTSSALATIGADGSADYEFDLGWELSLRSVASMDAAGAPDVIHTGSIATVLQPGAGSVRQVLDEHVGRALLTFDPNARPAITPDRRAVVEMVEDLVRVVDIVKVSDDDLRWYYPDEPVESGARRMASLSRRGLGLVALTRGEGGATLFHARGSFTVAAPRVTVVDTIAAGDTFTAALIDAVVRAGLVEALVSEGSGRVSQASLLDCVRWAVRAAAITVARHGADPPTRSEMLDAPEH